MTKFKVTILVSGDLLGTLIQAVMPQAKILEVVADNSEGKITRKAKRPRMSNGKTGRNLILEILSKKPASQEEMVKAFVADKRAAISVSPLTSTLNAEGKITQQSDGKWRLK